MESSNSYYTDLIIKHFNGEISSEEMLLLSDWLKSNPENQIEFKNYQETWELISQSRIEDSIDIDAEWGNFELKNLSSLKDNSSPKIVSFEKEIAKKQSFKQILRIAAIFILLATSSVFLYTYFNSPTNTHLVAENISVQKSLPDGTNITLNKGAEIDFSEKFDGNIRSVKLKGEAYFEVAHNPEKPFVISANNIRIEVLGTKFYVNTEAENNKVEVILESGKVAVYYDDKPNEKVILAPGDKVEISKETINVEKEINDNKNYNSWKTKNIIFTDNTLSEVVATLNKVYSSKIVIKDKKVSNCRLTGVYENKSIEAILNIIEETLDIKAEVKGQNIEITGVGCE